MLLVIGMVKLACCHKDKVINALFYVVEGSAPPLVSLQSSVDIGLIMLTYAVETFSQRASSDLDKQSVMNEYAELFAGIGVLPGECKLYIKENGVLVVRVNPLCRIPEALKTKFKEELSRMQRDNIITKVTEPTDRVNSIVVVEKPKTGKLRVCLDPNVLNEVIRRPHYPLPTIDDVTSKLAGATCFSLLDITHAYWSIKLDKEPSYLTTFSTPFGRYRYVHLPFEISASSEIFQMKID